MLPETKKVSRITRSCQKVAEQLLESPKRGRVQPLEQRKDRFNLQMIRGSKNQHSLKNQRR